MPRGGSRPGAGRKSTKKQAEQSALNSASLENKPESKKPHRFQPGVSGNPGGRPKEDAEIKRLARQQTKHAIARLAEWMRSDNAKASVTASVALLDRAWGRPTQAVTGPDGGPQVFVIASSADERL
jgi:hypothetical protein